MDKKFIAYITFEDGYTIEFTTYATDEDMAVVVFEDMIKDNEDDWVNNPVEDWYVEEDED